MHIVSLAITNFKCFKTRFEILLNQGLNLLVGDNEAGKSTVVEAIHLILTGLLNGRPLRHDLIQYIFNSETVSQYLGSLKPGQTALSPPEISIELVLEGEDIDHLQGNQNFAKTAQKGISLRIFFESKFQPEYEKLIKAGGVESLPIEYYSMEWSTFARDSITPRMIPIKSALIDSSASKYQNGSDIYISRIIREFLDIEDVVEISQAHRRMKDAFTKEESVKKINEKIQEAAKISEKKVALSVELSSKNAWESSLMTYLDEIPFHYIGKGEQCIIKTKLALSHRKAKEANIVLLEEPENHLSHTKLSNLIKSIVDGREGKQVLITTHSSFVANKLGLERLILLHNRKTVRLQELAPDTQFFFKKLSGYDTLRLILCQKAILVEGDSDELVVQKAFQKKYGCLPIEKGVDVISVGTAFLRFLEIAAKIEKSVSVVTDNDGDVEALKSKYADYLEPNKKPKINICFDPVAETGNLTINGKPYNYNTLESKMLQSNSLDSMNKILGSAFTIEDNLRIHMRANKTDTALKVFNTGAEISFPDYIEASINE